MYCAVDVHKYKDRERVLLGDLVVLELQEGRLPVAGGRCGGRGHENRRWDERIGNR